MDKNSFMKSLPDENPFKMAKLYEFLERAKDAGYPMATDEFYTPNVWSRVSAMKDYRDITVLGADYLERRIFVIHPDRMENPLCVAKVDNLDPMHSLKHKDYLGSLMSLGMNRERFGDVLVRGDTGYIVIFRESYSFIRENLHTIGRCGIDISLLEYEEALAFLEPTLTMETGIISSLRLDAVVALIARTSRSKALDALASGNVLLNYNVVRDKSKEIREGDTLTIRGTGKFRIGSIVGTTHKGNLRFEFHKFE